MQGVPALVNEVKASAHLFGFFCILNEVKVGQSNPKFCFMHKHNPGESLCKSASTFAKSD